MVGVKVGRGVRVIVGVSVMVGVSEAVAVGGKRRVRVGVKVGCGASITGYATVSTTRVKIKIKMIPRLVSKKRIRAGSVWGSRIAQRLDIRGSFTGYVCIQG
jgi:hypothetical protein